MEKVLISVIIPTFNNGEKITNPVNCIKNQLKPDGVEVEYEIIIIDDASTSEKFAEVQKVTEAEENIKLIRCENNGGPSVARNIGMKQATGDFITFLDSDDLWAENKIRLLLPLLTDPTVEIAGGKVKFVATGNAAMNFTQWEDEQQNATHVHLGALLVRRELIERGYFFDEDLRYSEDIDWWNRVREDGVGISIIEDTALIYQIHGENMTYQKTTELKRSLLQVMHKAIKRRKKKGIKHEIPQIRDFRKKREDLLISVIFPLTGDLKSAEEMVLNLKKQSYQNLEIILVDTEKNGISNNLKSKYPELQLAEKTNNNPVAAKNIGLSGCSGDILSFVSEGELWESNFLQKQWEILKENPYLAWFSEDGSKISMIRKHVFASVSGFNETLNYEAAERELIERLRKKEIKGKIVNESEM